MSAPTHTAPKLRRINRTILLTVGDSAAAVAQQTEALSRATVAHRLPLAITALSSEDGAAGDDFQQALRKRLSDTCDELADAALADALRRQGLSITFEEDLHLWFIVEIGAPGAEPVAALNALDLLEGIAWRRARLNVLPHLLLLAEPEQQEQLAAWRGAASRRFGCQTFLAGPVNQHHLRLPVTSWQGHAAAALSLLLWSRMPSHSSLAQSAVRGAAICAVGAVCWPAPRALLRAWCEKSWAATLLRRMQSGVADAQQATDVTQSMVEQLRLREEDIALVVPPPLSPESARGWRPDWGSLVTASDQLRRGVARRAAMYEMEQELARRAWLAERLDAWQKSLERRAAEHVAPNKRWPSLAAWYNELEELGRRLQAEYARVDAELQVATGRLAAADGALNREQQSLEALCSSFPANSLAGLATLLIQPWRWPFWAWAYWVTLPGQAQRLLDAWAHCQERAALEANLHTLRQLSLAAAQDVRRQKALLDALCGRMAQMDALVSPALSSLKGQAPSPWTAERLERLVRNLPDDDSSLAWSFIENCPLADWNAQDADDLLGRMTGYVRPALAQLDLASPAALLALAFASGPCSTDGNVQTLDDWLTDFQHAAAPLWPVAADQHDLYCEEWFFAPEGIGTGAAAVDCVRSWIEAQSGLFLAESALDAVAVLRWMWVDLLPSN